MNYKGVKELKTTFSNKVWKKRGNWYHTVFYNEIFADGESTTYSKKLGYPFKKTYMVWLQNGDCLDLLEDWNGIKKDFEDQLASDKSYFNKYADHCLLQANELIALCNEIGQKKLNTFSDNELAQQYCTFIEALKEFMPFMFSLHLVDEFLTEQFTKELNDFINEKGMSKTDFFDYQTALTLPYRKILVLEEQESLLAIAVHVVKNNLNVENPDIETLLREHTKKYSWINAYGFERNPYTAEDFKKHLLDLLKTDVLALESLKSRGLDEIKKRQATIMEEIKDNSNLFELSKLIQIFGFLRSYRVDAPCYSFTLAFTLLEEVARRLEISVSSLQYLDSKEVSQSILGKFEFDHHMLISERMKGSSSASTGTERYEFTQNDAMILAEIVKLPTETKSNDIKGMIAYPGKITAHCKILRSLNDMEKIEKGDILVIAMTDPNYIPAMVRASAFVTDQGGILCHAAIVSREMKKPCIIGTKIATQVLKDGDLVEVDAERGIVTIHKRASES